MTYMEFLESLVNAETEDERMELVKANADSFAPQEGGGEEMQAQLDEMTATLEESTATVATLKQEIKDRFFGKFKEEGETEEMETEEEETETPEASLKDLGFGQKTY